MFIATYEGYKYDAVALGKTKREARDALIEEWRRQFPDTEMTTEDWKDSIAYFDLRPGQAEVH